ncbi:MULTISPECIES: PRC-barrel domain-containing protein [unclassified Dietzia]|uniref:PRC-barrel domain-containing protein n=3 Tax=Dietzia TaxID=37914 RepID=UPI001315E4A2|nr:MULTISPECIES: PRC-barrel domain-containing protein [unclassified Dietzia]QGW23578.1 hypothetical protein GJR88_00809 [Dietzia sp. DQ12-45-1b]
MQSPTPADDPRLVRNPDPAPTSTPGDPVTLKDQLDALLDATAFDSTGAKIGAVRQVYVDDASGKITFATVSTGIFSSDAIVPLHGARLLDDELHVDHTRAVIRDSPRPDHTEDALTPEQEVRLLEYYGIDAPTRERETAPATTEKSAATAPAGAAADGKAKNSEATTPKAPGNAPDKTPDDSATTTEDSRDARQSTGTTTASPGSPAGGGRSDAETPAQQKGDTTPDDGGEAVESPGRERKS